MTIGLFTHADCLDHDPGPRHPESPARLSATLAALQSCAFAASLDVINAPLGSRDQCLLVHTEAHVRAMEEPVPANTRRAADPDTVLSSGSLRAAQRAVGAACSAVDYVMDGRAPTAFCAVRPPGHHALADDAMGFCLFNSIAIAARHAMSRHSLTHVAIVDFDVHHGNGTEAIFLAEPAVLYASTHQWPFYPGTGSTQERGVGNIVNVPLAQGTDGTRYRQAFTANILPALAAHRPELILVSAGFDAHRDDPLAGLELVEDDFQWIGAQLREASAAYCEGRIVSFLEGGYALDALANSVVAYLSAFAA